LRDNRTSSEHTVTVYNFMPKKSVNVFLRGGGGTPTYGCTLSPLGEYYFPPKLLTAAAMRSYVKLRSPLVRFAVSHIAHATLTWHYIILKSFAGLQNHLDVALLLSFEWI